MLGHLPGLGHWYLAVNCYFTLLSNADFIKKLLPGLNHI